MEYNTRNLEFLLPLLRLRESLAIKFCEQWNEVAFCFRFVLIVNSDDEMRDVFCLCSEMPVDLVKFDARTMQALVELHVSRSSLIDLVGNRPTACIAYEILCTSHTYSMRMCMHMHAACSPQSDLWLPYTPHIGHEFSPHTAVLTSSEATQYWYKLSILIAIGLKKGRIWDIACCWPGRILLWYKQAARQYGKSKPL